VADLILQEQSPKRLMDVRGKVYELLSHCIPATVVLRVSVSVSSAKNANSARFLRCPLERQTVTDRLVEKVDDELKPQIIHWASHYVGERRELNRRAPSNRGLFPFPPGRHRNSACNRAQRRYTTSRRTLQR
jgi:replication factor C subunit 3/5